MNTETTCSQPVNPTQDPALAVPGEQLEDAFALFNSLSEKLVDSYNELEQQVARLSSELADAKNQRMQQLMEKERLARRLQILLDTLPAGVIVTDGDGIIRQCNPLAAGMLGEDIEGHAWQQVAQRAIISDNDALRLHDGRWLSVSTRTLQGEPGSLVLLADVTETRALQDKLARQQRLGSLGEMVASLAHQLRTPLATALLYTSNLQRDDLGETRRQRFVGKTRERLLHLERMVNDMLTFARGDVTAAENLRVTELMQRFENIIRAPLRAAGIRLRIDSSALGEDVIIRANADSLLSIFQNLVDNAVAACHASPRKSSACLQIVCRQRRSQVCLRFIDNGCGISEPLLNRILEPFYTTRAAGTGLGLAVVNATVQSLQGELHIESTPGEGSCFEIRLPRVEANALLSSDVDDSRSLSDKVQAAARTHRMNHRQTSSLAATEVSL